MGDSLIQTIYFDESGFTGNRLLDKDQPFFVYASIAIDDFEAAATIKKIRADYGLLGKELKGRRLVRNNRGRKAITYVLERSQSNMRIAVSHKKYSLASKFFEYIFEPVLASQSSIFYSTGFHRFISNLLFLEFTARSACAEDIFVEFESLMRSRDRERLQGLLAPISDLKEFNKPLGQFLTFAMCHQDTIANELEVLFKMGDPGKWALELTTSALFGLLSYWSEKYDQLNVYCDNSKPIEAHQMLFDVMVDREDKCYQYFGQRERAITFNLCQPIQLVDSCRYSGIQIADLVASGLAYAMKFPKEEISIKWLDISKNSLDDTCIIPDFDEADLSKRGPFINALILQELVDRTVKSEDLFEEIPKFIEIANIAYDRQLTI